MTTFEGTRGTFIYVTWRYQVFVSKDEDTGIQRSMDEWKWEWRYDYRYFDAFPDSDLLYVSSTTSRGKKALGIKTRKGYKRAVEFKNRLTNRFENDAFSKGFYCDLKVRSVSPSGSVYHSERWLKKRMQHNLYKSSLNYVNHEITKKVFEDDNKYVHFNSMVKKPSKTSRRRRNNREKKGYR